MRRGRLGVLAVVSTVVGLLAVLVVARSAPSHPFGHAAYRTGTVPVMTSSAPSRPVPTITRNPKATESLGAGPMWAMVVLAILGLLVVLWVVLKLRVRLGRHAVSRFPGRGVRPPAAPLVVPDEVARTLEDALDTVLDRGPVAAAIIACWLRVERALADAGSPRRPSETSTEYVDRVLVAYGVQPAPLHALAQLYREARFSTHPMGEDAREAARAGWETVRADLSGLHRAG